MRHRHITTEGWTLMAIESLFDRGTLADWRDLAEAIRNDGAVAARVAQVCRYRESDGAERIAMAVIAGATARTARVARA